MPQNVANSVDPDEMPQNVANSVDPDEMPQNVANSVDPDEMPQNVAFHLGLHYFCQSSQFRVSSKQWVKMFFLCHVFYRELLTMELESVGIRLNKKKPNIYFKVSL